MEYLTSLGPVFVAVAVIFVVVTFQNYLEEEGKLTPARRTWLRIAMIFSGVGIGLYFVHWLLP